MKTMQDLLRRASIWAPHDGCWAMHQELLLALTAALARAEAAEARVMELEKDAWLDHNKHETEMEELKADHEAERDAIEAKTIERAAQVADRIDSVNGIAAAIRALLRSPSP